VTKRSRVLLLCLSLLLTSCAGPWWIALHAPVPTTGPLPSPVVAPPTASPAESPAAFGIADLAVGKRDTSPSVPSADLRALVSGNTAFALDLYHRVAGDPKAGNIALGPYSISAALAMLQAGTAGKTKTQIEDALHYNLPLQRLDNAFNALSLALASRNTSDVAVSVADRAFGQESYPFRQSYLRRLTGSFDAPMAALDYRHEWVLDRQLINEWVSDKTNGAIDELIPDRDPPYVDANTRLALVDAMYLNAKWAHPFPDEFTHPGFFFREDGSKVEVPVMEEDIATRYTQNDTYQAVEIPYKGGQLSMLLVMPMGTQGFDAFERKLTPASISDIEGGMRRGMISELNVPRFSARTKLELTETLKAMGMTDAFTQQVADLSGIADPADINAIGERPLYTTAVLHQAWIKVGEKGTQGAAATGVLVGEGGPLTILDFNQPFMWFIRDQQTGTILFMGRVMDPSQE
jgi:serine protease inhibitor